MIKAKDAIKTARGLIGTPYKEMDCINLIKKVIRISPGGVPGYTTAHTNALWDSVNNSGKYRHLIERHESLAGAQAGMLAFKRSGEDVHHVGLVTGEGTVIHSSVKGCVVETALTAAEGWELLAVHRYIETAGTGKTEEDMSVLYMATVVTQEDPLRVRDYPATGRILGHVPKGKTVEVLEERTDGWLRIRYNELEGYASVLYLERIGTDLKPVSKTEVKEDTLGEDRFAVGVTLQVVIKDSAGNEFRPVGECTVDVEIVEESID